mgnify:CR=1 FL=1
MLFRWMINTFASLRYGQHGCMNVKVRMPQLTDFVREFYLSLGGFYPFSSARFGTAMKSPLAMACPTMTDCQRGRVLNWG